MSKKHFIELADRLREIMPQPDKDGNMDVPWESVVDMVVEFCRSQNSRFDESRFRGYINGECGPSGGRIKKAA